jgi:hypothetical protein
MLFESDIQKAALDAKKVRLMDEEYKMVRK